MSTKKYVYLVERAQLSRITNEYSFYDCEVFSSLKKAQQSIDDSIRINGGFEVEKPIEGFKNFDKLNYVLFNYKCLNNDVERILVSLRIKLSKRFVN